MRKEETSFNGVGIEVCIRKLVVESMVACPVKDRALIGA